MKEVENYITSRFNNVWDKLEEVEKKEFHCFGKYIKFIKENCNDYSNNEDQYVYYKNFFMRKFIGYLDEAYSSLLLEIYNAFSGAMSVIIENYVCFYLIKKYRDDELYNDWYVFSLKKELFTLKDNTAKYNEFKKLYELECKTLNIDDSLYDINDSYSWLSRVVKPNAETNTYDFKYVSSLLNSHIYNDYNEISGNIHSVDYLSKNRLTLMEKTYRYLIMLFNYTNAMIKEYDINIFDNKEYVKLKEDLLNKLKNCFNVWNDPIDLLS